MAIPLECTVIICSLLEIRVWMPCLISLLYEYGVEWPVTTYVSSVYSIFLPSFLSCELGTQYFLIHHRYPILLFQISSFLISILILSLVQLHLKPSSLMILCKLVLLPQSRMDSIKLAVSLEMICKLFMKNTKIFHSLSYIDF